MLGLACSTLSCDGFGDNDFVRTFEIMPKVGFRYVEFNCWHPSTITPHKMIDLKRRCDETGLKPIAVYGNGFGGANHQEITRDVGYKIRMIEAARELGCRRIVATGAARGEAGGLDAIIKTLKEIVPAAEQYDTLICLENHADNNLENIDDYKRIFDAVSSDKVGICIDTGHFDAAGVDLNDLIDSLGNYVNHLHLKENKGFGTKEFTKFGEGTTDNINVIKRMTELGFKGYMSIELSPEVESQKGVPFEADDLMIPKKMFEPYEIP